MKRNFKNFLFVIHVVSIMKRSNEKIINISQRIAKTLIKTREHILIIEAFE
jgi:hypothetical protein